MLQYGMLNTKLKKYPIYFRFFSCIGQSDQQGVDRRMYASGCWNSFLEYSYIRFTKGQQVTQDTQKSRANLLNQTQDILTLLSLA